MHQGNYLEIRHNIEFTASETLKTCMLPVAEFEPNQLSSFTHKLGNSPLFNPSFLFGSNFS
ncbi:MAG: hypothetical protein EU541_05650 [Promethearchaeota archaeon]|nr:MAG: hypothetical protein EU541_05650 [Candidatus Lokiarchaeota archaeon]